MNNSTFTFLIIPIIVIITIIGVRYVRNKIYRPTYENGVQKPGKLEGCILKLLIFMDAILVMMFVLGILVKEPDMTIVSGGLALFILIIIIVLKYANNTSYQENNEYLILKSKNKEYKIFYENIIDWRPSFNEIALLDKSRPNEKYVNINIKIYKPEILLRKISDMAFDGKFYSLDENYLEDPNREAEIVYYLVNNHYGYLIKDYVEKVENKF